jgi:DnaK suppressor protein
VAVDVERFRGLLQEERQRVLDAIEYLQKENPGSIEDETDDETTDNHLAETATVTLDREIDYTLEENSENVLSSIEGALERIDEGTYGTCVNCGNPIHEDRLVAIPWATHCIGCKRLEERGLASLHRVGSTSASAPRRTR